jgi:uncharacterized Zn-binding protein involved in type VI secretion
VVSAPGRAVDLLNTGFATATNALSQALPAQPAARLGSLAVGLPHAHVAHPPGGPLPVVPVPPAGSVLLGTCVSVLINGTPAARCGDLGVNPTCCGLPPLFEVATGSSKIFIGGGRAARQMDVTWHCKPASGGAGARAAAMAARAAVAAAMKAAAMKLLAAGNVVAQAASIAGDAVEAARADDPALSAAMAQSAGFAAAQMANDAAAMAAAAAMGKDQPCIPPTGTPGALMSGSSSVMIGGFPMPAWTNVARGLLKAVRAARARAAGKRCGRKTAGKAKGKGTKKKAPS